MKTGTVVTTVLVLGLASISPAMAATDIYPPFWRGGAVSARIGSTTVSLPSGGTEVRQVIVWQTAATGACATTILGGPSGLFDDFHVHGSGGNDLLEIQFWWLSTTKCGQTIDPLVYGGHYLDISGGPGNDVVSCLSRGDTYVAGEDGNDGLYSDNPFGLLSGGAGNDSIFSDGGPEGREIVYGGDGDDCLSDHSGNAAIFDCGTGTDRLSTANGWHVPDNAISCESFALATCPLI